MEEFVKFMEERIESLKASKRIGTANNYKRAKSSLERYLEGKELRFREVDKGFVDRYEEWMKKRGMVRNSISFHMRILRAVFNKGVRRGYAHQTFPFAEAYTGIDKTRKRFVGKSVLKRLRELPLDDPEMDKARDIFLFSIYSRGMAYIDIAFLRWEDIKGREIVYRRRKTGGLLKIKLEKELKGILEKYKGRGRYVFGILEEGEEEWQYKEYERSLSGYNYRLGKISERLGLCERLTSYTARHTWAMLARSWDVPVGVISAGMGHRSEQTTRIYLAEMDNGPIDRANRRILDRLWG